MSTGSSLSFGETVCLEGRLSKRQRGRRESTSRGFFSKSPASLKFQERHFMLTNRRLIYRDKKNDTVIKGEFPISRVEVVEMMAFDVFHKDNVIQVGDDDEVLYLVAPSAKECGEWVAALQKAALKNGNQMLEWYHHGIYGKNNKWACCRGVGRTCMGCTQATKYSGMDSKKTQRLVQAEQIHEDALRHRERSAVRSQPEQTSEQGTVRATRSQSFDIQAVFSTVKDVTKKRSSSASEDSGRGSSIPPSPGSLLLPHAVTDHHPAQEGTEQSPLTKATQPPNITPPTPPTERRSSGASLEGSSHSSEEGHPLLSLSYSQVHKPTTPKRDSVAVLTFQNGFNSLHSAIRDGNIASVTMEIESGVDMELPTATSPPVRPLVLAFNYDHFQVMELLLIRGADPNGVEPQNHSTLLHVVAGRGSTNMAGLLLRHGGDVNAKTSKGDTPMHIAAREGHVEVVQLFLKSGCRVNEVNNKERTPLHEAAEAGHVAMVKLLLAGGGNPLLREGDFEATPYILACKAQKKEVCGLLQSFLSPHQQPYSLVATLDGAHPGPVETIAFCSSHTLASSGGDTQVTLWKLDDGCLDNKASIPTGETVLAVSHFGGRLAASSSAVHVVDTSDHTEAHSTLDPQLGDPRDPPLLVASFAPSGELIVAGTDDKSTEVQVWPMTKSNKSLPAEPLTRFDGGKDGPCCIYSLAVSPVATPPVLAVSVQPGTLFKAAGNKLIHLWEYSSGKHLRTLDVGHGGVKVSLFMSFSQDGRYLAVACVDVVTLWSVDTGEAVQSIAPEASIGVFSVCFCPSGAHLAVGCERGLVKVYSTADYKALFELQEQKGDITCLAYSRDGEWMATGASDGSLCVWRGKPL